MILASSACQPATCIFYGKNAVQLNVKNGV